ncbi:MAG: hypothetical protein ABFS35_09390 [Bacteroidota bacterium]
MKHILLLLSILFFSVIGASQTDEYVLTDTLTKEFNLFGREKPLSFTLKSDFRKFRKEKYKGKYQKAQLIYKINDSTEINKEVRIKARGEFRRRHCSLPPIRLNWRKKDVVKKELSKYYKLKMVTHCNNSKYYKVYILKEFLCYKLYNILTDMSFKVQLIDVKYIDTGNKKKNEHITYAFFIEDLDMLAERNNALVIESEKLGIRNVEKQNIMQLAFFQFMVGNADWSITGLHNIKLIKSKDYQQTKAWAIPYDYDYCGMVNASYAIPGESKLNVKSVTERVYLGICQPESEFKSVIEQFNKHKDEFYDEINNFKYLDPRNKKEMIEYLDEFYKTIASKNFYNSYLKAHCKRVD